MASSRSDISLSTPSCGVAMCLLTVDSGDQRGASTPVAQKSKAIHPNHKNKSSASIACCMDYSDVPSTSHRRKGCDPGDGETVLPQSRLCGAAAQSNCSFDVGFKPKETAKSRGKKRVGFDLAATSIIEEASERSSRSRQQAAALEEETRARMNDERRRLDQNAELAAVKARERSIDVARYNKSMIRNRTGARKTVVKNPVSVDVGCSNAGGLLTPFLREENSQNASVGKAQKAMRYRQDLDCQTNRSKQTKLRMAQDEKDSDLAVAKENQIKLIESLKLAKFEGQSKAQQLKYGLDLQIMARNGSVI